MRQARGAEHQGDAQRQQVDFRGGRRAVLGARGEHVAGRHSRGGCLGDHLLRRAEDVGEVEAELGQHQDRHDSRAGDQQNRLDDLHPGGAGHAADEHVDDHQYTDDGDHQRLRAAAVDIQQQCDQSAGAGHLGQQVEQRDRHRRGGGRQPDRASA